MFDEKEKRKLKFEEDKLVVEKWKDYYYETSEIIDNLFLQGVNNYKNCYCDNTALYYVDVKPHSACYIPFIFKGVRIIITKY